MTSDPTAAQRARLAEFETALAQLRAQYDVLMNGFKFDAARALVPRIEAAERAAKALAQTLSSPPEPVPTPFTVTRRRRGR
jgi:hypothetical protein